MTNKKLRTRFQLVPKSKLIRLFIRNSVQQVCQFSSVDVLG